MTVVVQAKTRFWEIDTVRGIAIVMMITYHILFDITFLGLYHIDLFTLPMRLFLYPIGTTFLILVGMGLTVSYEHKKQYLSSKQLLWKYIQRGVLIFMLGMVLTVVTWFLVPDSFIMFGVLHCIGVCILLSYPFLHKSSITLPLGLICILVGIALRTTLWGFPWLLWLGFIPQGFSTLDYFPLLPWFGVVLIGIYLGKLLYPHGKRGFNLPDFSANKAVMFLSLLGRHSLAIYFVHQPVILLVLFIVQIW